MKDLLIINKKNTELSNLNVVVPLDCDTERSIEGNIFFLHCLDIYLLEQAGVGHNLVPEHDHVNQTPSVDPPVHNGAHKTSSVLSLYYKFFVTLYYVTKFF